MKKIIAFIITLVLVLGTVNIAAAAPADVMGTEYEGAATRLGALGIMVGDSRGFRPYDTITRAEFSILVVRALGLEAAAKFSTTPTRFEDVPDSYSWAWGYINVAAEQGIIKGYSETAFGPGDPVTYEQAITVIVRALGYEPAIIGGYPAGYLAKAAELDITEDVAVVAGVGAPRGAVAQMLDNALTVKLMERKTYGDEANYEAVDKNLLENKLGVKVITGVITDVDDDEVTIDADNNKYDDDYELADDVAADHLVGMVVEAWKYKDKIVYIENDSSLIYDYIAALTDEDGRKVDDDGERIAGSEIRKVELLNAGKTYKTDDSIDLFLDDEAAVDRDIRVGQFAKFVVDGSRIIRLEAYAVDDVVDGLIEDVDKDYIEYLKGTASGKRFRIKGCDKLTVIINGRAAAYEDLGEHMVFSAYKNGDDYLIVATDKIAEGRMNRYKDGDEVRIDGKTYDLAGGYGKVFLSIDLGDEYKDYDTEILDDMLGEDVTAYLNTRGYVVYIGADVEVSTSSFYAYVKKGWSGEYEYVKLLNHNGVDVTYKLDFKEINDAESPSPDVEVDDDFGRNVPAGLVKGVFKFYVDEDGYVVDIDNPEHVASFEEDDVTAFSDKNGTITIGGTVYYVTSKTVIFDFTDDDESDYTVIDWDEIKGSKKLSDLEGTIAYNNKREIEYIVFDAGLDTIGDDNVFVAFVLDKAKVTSSKYEFRFELPGSDEDIVRIDQRDVNGAEKDNAVLYTLNYDGTGVIERVWNCWYDLSPLASFDEDYDSGFQESLDSDDDVDDSFIRVNGKWYRVADDAIIYEVVYDGDDVDEYERADLGDIDRRDAVSIFTMDGVIKMLFFRAK